MTFSDFYKYLELALKIMNNQVHDSEFDFINKTLLIQDIVMKETMKSLTQILNIYTAPNHNIQDGAIGNFFFSNFSSQPLLKRCFKVYHLPKESFLMNKFFCFQFFLQSQFLGMPFCHNYHL